jgi:small subunit ribosomal protein S11e
MVLGPSFQGTRWTKDVGLGFKTPKEAKVGTYVDKKCPFTGKPRKSTREQL